MAEQETENEAAAEAPKKSLIKKLLLPVLLIGITAGGTVGGLMFTGMLGGESAPAAAVDGEAVPEGDAPPAPAADAGGPAFFFTLYPDLLVNFTADGQPHFLKVTIDVMAREEDVIKGVEEYHSIVRNNLLRAFQQVEFETVESQQGIDSMRALALEEIEKVLATYHGSSDIEGVYFTSFVVQ